MARIHEPTDPEHPIRAELRHIAASGKPITDDDTNRLESLGVPAARLRKIRLASEVIAAASAQGEHGVARMAADKYGREIADEHGDITIGDTNAHITDPTTLADLVGRR